MWGGVANERPSRGHGGLLREALVAGRCHWRALQRPMASHSRWSYVSADGGAGDTLHGGRRLPQKAWRTTLRSRASINEACVQQSVHVQTVFFSSCAVPFVKLCKVL